jgi:hypothetical protein
MTHKTLSNAFVKPNNPILIKIAKAVPLEKMTTPETKENISKMLKVALGEQMDSAKPMLVGLAAPQIGISQRIILVDIKANGKGKVGDLRVYINPEIIEISKEATQWYEGCFSTDRVCGVVERPISVTIKAYTPEGREVVEKHSGYTARIFQHEIDHLNGKEFVSHIIDDDKLHWVEDKQFPEYRNKEGWRNWKFLCSREKWMEIKGMNKKSMNIPVYVSISHILNGIRCIRAARDIKKDELIESSPIILIPRDEQDDMDDMVLSSYTYDWNNTHGAFILGYCLLTNHSYTPNIIYTRDFEMLQMNYYALRDIKKDEELFVNYNGKPGDMSPLEEHYIDYKY